MGLNAASCCSKQNTLKNKSNKNNSGVKKPQGKLKISKKSKSRETHLSNDTYALYDGKYGRETLKL